MRDDHQEVAGGISGQLEDAVGLFVLTGGSELIGVVGEEAVHVQETLSV